MGLLTNFQKWADEHEYQLNRAGPADKECAAPDQHEEVVRKVGGSASNLVINEWSVDDWRKIPGVGVVLANRLLDGAPYEMVEDTKRVKGVSDAVVVRIKEQLASCNLHV